MDPKDLYEMGVLPLTQYSSLLINIFNVTHPSNLPIPRPPKRTHVDNNENEREGLSSSKTVLDRLSSMAMGDSFMEETARVGMMSEERLDFGLQQSSRARQSSESSSDEIGQFPSPSLVSNSSVSLDDQFNLDTRTERLEWLQCLLGLYSNPCLLIPLEYWIYFSFYGEQRTAIET